MGYGIAEVSQEIMMHCLDNGKVLDKEPLLEFCKGCIMKNDLKQIDSFAHLKCRNSHICKFDYVGNAGRIKTEEEKQLVQGSVEKHNLRYVEYLGDGCSKSYMSVKNVYEGT